jgi:hypothetical protein
VQLGARWGYQPMHMADERTMLAEKANMLAWWFSVGATIIGSAEHDKGTGAICDIFSILYGVFL